MNIFRYKKIYFSRELRTENTLKVAEKEGVILTLHYKAAPGLLVTDLVIWNLAQMRHLSHELSRHFPNFHATTTWEFQPLHIGSSMAPELDPMNRSYRVLWKCGEGVDGSDVTFVICP
ncbi:hypothetical protein TNCV_4851421 [Trichonephila clavipes]|nr:hypothetical protein TNCV_4851421 [Trichonephila clavipes]